MENIFRIKRKFRMEGKKQIRVYKTKGKESVYVKNNCIAINEERETEVVQEERKKGWRNRRPDGKKSLTRS